MRNSRRLIQFRAPDPSENNNFHFSSSFFRKPHLRVVECKKIVTKKVKNMDSNIFIITVFTAK